MEQNAKKQSMILVAVNQGYTEAVMATAKAAGARGGTVIRSHILRSEEHDSFGGPTFAGERELLVIVASSQGEPNAIMERQPMPFSTPCPSSRWCTFPETKRPGGNQNGSPLSCFPSFRRRFAT